MHTARGCGSAAGSGRGTRVTGRPRLGRWRRPRPRPLAAALQFSPWRPRERPRGAPAAPPRAPASAPRIFDPRLFPRPKFHPRIPLSSPYRRRSGNRSMTASSGRHRNRSRGRERRVPCRCRGRRTSLRRRAAGKVRPRSTPRHRLQRGQRSQPRQPHLAAVRVAGDHQVGVEHAQGEIRRVAQHQMKAVLGGAGSFKP